MYLQNNIRQYNVAFFENYVVKTW